MRKNGWAVQYVESDRTPFAYTIGLHDWGLPELLVTGVSPPRASRLLNGVARDALRGLSLTPGSQIKVQAGPLIEIVDVDHPDAHMGWAVESGGPDVRAVPSPDAIGLIVDVLGKLRGAEGWTRLIIEKPFGHDLESALALNTKLWKHFDE